MIRFNQTTYSVNESGGSATPVIKLSNPSSTDIDIIVFGVARSGVGECICANISCHDVNPLMVLISNNAIQLLS